MKRNAIKIDLLQISIFELVHFGLLIKFANEGGGSSDFDLKQTKENAQIRSLFRRKKWRRKKRENDMVSFTCKPKRLKVEGE